MTERFILYGTFGCHLCDAARDIVEPALGHRAAALEEVDIAGDDDLEDRYGVSIPVLRHVGSGRELHWPFDDDGLRRFLDP